MDESTLIEKIRQSLLKDIDSAAFIKIIDETHKHKKHKGFIEGKRHFALEIASDKLNSISKIKAHKSIYKAIDPLMEHIHALSIKILADKEPKNA
jgi:BolA protein